MSNDDETGGDDPLLRYTNHERHYDHRDRMHHEYEAANGEASSAAAASEELSERTSLTQIQRV